MTNSLQWRPRPAHLRALKILLIIGGAFIFVVLMLFGLNYAHR